MLKHSRTYLRFFIALLDNFHSVMDMALLMLVFEGIVFLGAFWYAVAVCEWVTYKGSR